MSRFNFAKAKFIFNIIDIIEINILKMLKKITRCPSAEEQYIKRLHYIHHLQFGLHALEEE
ncbi:MAG: hypothetical protein ACO3OZ_16755, partial [bacterium]